MLAMQTSDVPGEATARKASGGLVDEAPGGWEMTLPAGRYYSATGILRPDRGGQTEAMLLRGRVLGTARGEPVDVLTFDPSPHYDRYRAALRASGRLDDDAQVVNLYEFYRDHGWGDEAASGATGLPRPPS